MDGFSYTFLAEGRARLDGASSWPSRPRGIWPSELLAFLTWCLAYRITHVVESGIHLGQSTLMLARALPADVVFCSVDVALQSETCAEIRGANSLVDIVEGDISDVLPLLLNAIPDAGRVALLLDGPKGDVALDLVARYDRRLCFAAIHDMYRAADPRIHNHPRERVDTYEHHWATDDAAYVACTRDIDGERHHEWLDEGGNGKLPYRLLHRSGTYPLLSYGPTLAFVFLKMPVC